MNKFSVILPVHNGGEYIKECVASVLSQTLQNFDLLILDNKSSDGTSEWLASLKDTRIKIFPSVKPLTIEDNWNRALDIPKNKFMTLIGHDDVLMPQYLEVMNLLIDANKDASLYQTHFIFIDAKGNKIRDCLRMNSIMENSEFIGKALQRTIDINGTGFMFRSDLYNTLNGIPSFPKLMFADYALWFSIAQKGSVAVAETPAFKYRLHQNTSQMADPVIYYKALKEFTSFLKQLMNDPDLQVGIKENAPAFIAHFCKSICHKMLRYPLPERDGITVSQTVAAFEKECKQISGNPSYSITNNVEMKAALLIDSSKPMRYLFRKFRQLYNKPFLK
ncbi:MAG TPA: glycosyltransferase [Niabella sp.]|uniref:glycosyltransferase family 2 protein n=1 Tax=Agriterribacter sp. TaxID=2821509 RepID=UPI002CDC4E72|nr:glycosyltransferase [Agriterribacter sp.]HRO85735.1 glycosyltransferase [Niabella sp.]HRP54963.1 glycosyltransferase [Agriterribacter sp.]